MAGAGWGDWRRQDSETSVPAEALGPSRDSSWGRRVPGEGEKRRWGPAPVCSHWQCPAQAPDHESARGGLARTREPGLPWRWVRPGAHRSRWPDLFLNTEACVNTEAFITTPEASVKRDRWGNLHPLCSASR